MKKPLMLLILDGWGYSPETSGNAIASVDTPTFDHLWNSYPHALIEASGLRVGLPGSQMGNSEVGHINMGAGRVVYQDLTRIDKAIVDKDFFDNEVFKNAIDKTITNNKAVHIMGLVSDGGIHSHQTHFAAIIDMAIERGAREVYLHAFLDGRDTPPKSAQKYLQPLDAKLREANVGRIASICGRFYAMDRDKRWERVEAAYNMLTKAQAEFSAETAVAGLQMAYERGESDEFVKCTTIRANNEALVKVEDGDSLIFMDFRADRAREISHAFVDDNFSEFPREHKLNLASYVSLTQYEQGLAADVAFPPQELTNVLGECLADDGLTQLRIAETEKYAHVTFFFNGGREEQFVGEDRILIPSPKVSTYDLKPDMSVLEITDKLVGAIKSNKYDMIICNFANPDMLGHTGKIEQTEQAIATVDQCLAKAYDAIKAVGGGMIVTADHGNAEKMMDPVSGQPHTAHTSNPVPFIYVGDKAKIINNDAALEDIAPTVLYLLEQKIPADMSGKPIVELV